MFLARIEYWIKAGKSGYIPRRKWNFPLPQSYYQEIRGIIYSLWVYPILFGEQLENYIWKSMGGPKSLN